jgi:hypothetical protein
MYAPIFLFIALVSQSLAYLVPINIGTDISRRQLLTGISTCVVLQKPALAIDDENRPLTSVEMEEYNKWLKDAERIQSIIKDYKRRI